MKKYFPRNYHYLFDLFLSLYYCVYL